MKTVWKYHLLPNCRLVMPTEAQILTIAAQGADICLWALVDPTRPSEWRNFRVYGTGHQVDDTPSRFLGTAFSDGMVFHAFEVFP